MATPHPAICWTFFYKSRKTLTLPPLAQWVQGQGPDRVRGPDQDQVRAAVHQQAELQVAEQVLSRIHTVLNNDEKYQSVIESFLVFLKWRTGSSNTSKYFGSVDSLEHDHQAKAKGKTRSEGGSDGGQSQLKVSSQAEGEHFIKYVLQEPLWLLMANADDKVMMTYQMPTR